VKTLENHKTFRLPNRRPRITSGNRGVFFLSCEDQVGDLSHAAAAGQSPSACRSPLPMRLPRLPLLLLLLVCALLATPVDGKSKKKGDVKGLFAALGSADPDEARNAAQTLSQRSPLLGVHADEAHRRTQVLVDAVAGKGDVDGGVDGAVNELAAYVQKLVRAIPRHTSPWSSMAHSGSVCQRALPAFCAELEGI
jgi:hypothetical protein